jgi:hypothetical protein
MVEARMPAFTAYITAIAALLVLPALIPTGGALQGLSSVRNWQILATALFAGQLIVRRYDPSRAAAVWRAPPWLRPLLYAAGLSSLLACCLLHFQAFRINGIDFSTFDHMLWSTRHGRFMYSPILGGNHFGVHPSWIMLPLVPLQALFETPFLLVAAHALAAWLALFPLERLARRFLRADALVMLTLIAYLTHARTGSIVNHGFHFEVFYLPIGLWMLDAWTARSDRAFVVWLVLFLSVKEDAGLYVAGLGAGAVCFERERRGVGAGLVALGLSAFVGSVALVQPLFREAGQGTPQYVTFWGKYGATVPAIVTGMLARPHVVLLDVLQSGWIELWGSFLFLPLLGRQGLVACLPVVLLLGTSASPQMHAYNGYYSAALLPFFLLAFFEGAARLGRSPRLVLAALLVAPLIGGDYMKFPSPRPQYGKALSAAVAEARRVGAPVCVQTILFPHLPYDLPAHPFTPECQVARQASALLVPELDAFPYTPAELDAYLAAASHRRDFGAGLTFVAPASKR